MQNIIIFIKLFSLKIIILLNHDAIIIFNKNINFNILIKI